MHLSGTLHLNFCKLLPELLHLGLPEMVGILTPIPEHLTILTSCLDLRSL